MAIEARIVGTPGISTGALAAAAPIVELKFVLPLTTYLAQPTLQFRLTPKTTGGSVTTGPWRDWRLDTLGNVVAIEAALLQEG